MRFRCLEQLVGLQALLRPQVLLVRLVLGCRLLMWVAHAARQLHARCTLAVPRHTPFRAAVLGLLLRSGGERERRRLGSVVGLSFVAGAP